MSQEKSQTVSTHSRRRYKKKRYIIPILLIALLIAFRIYLPTLVKNYINDVLADIPGYYGQVDDIHMALYRGGYRIQGMYLDKVNADSQIPFLKFPEADISIEWASLVNGKIVSEILLKNPEITYVFEDQDNASEEGDADVEDWTKALTDIVPININHLEVTNGKLGFVQLQQDPNIDLYLDKLELTALNLRNVENPDVALPSSVSARAVSIGKGAFKLDGDMNLIKQIPDMDMNFALEDADVTAINSLTSKYAGIDFKEGNLNIYGEIAIADGYMNGYVKPLLKDSKLISKEDGILSVIWEGFVGMFKFILKNQGTNTLATRVPIEGNLSDVKTDVWSTVFNIFKNAWFNAFQGELDKDVNYDETAKDAEWDKMTDEERDEFKRAKEAANENKNLSEKDKQNQE